MTDKSLAPRQARSKATKKALLEAMDRLLAEKPLEALRVSEVAAEAGLTTGAIYHLFGDKRGMLAAVIHRGIDQFEALETANPKGYAPGLSDDQLVMSLVQDYFGIAFDNLRAMQALALVRDGEVFSDLMNARFQVASWFAGILQSSPHSPKDLAQKVNFVLRTLVAVYVDTLRLMKPGLSKEQYLSENKEQLDTLFAELHHMSCLYLGVKTQGQ